MSDFLDDVQANATVTSAAWVDSNSGSRGIRTRFQWDPEDSDPLKNGANGITHDIWITAKSANMAHKALKSLGLDSDTVDAHRFKYEIDSLLIGAKCTLVCGIEEANEFHDDDRWKVKFINERRAESTGEPPDVLSLLKARPVNPKKAAKKKAPNLPLVSGERPTTPVPHPIVDDTDVPF